MMAITNAESQTIREILNDNEADLSHACLWLADTYDTLPNFDYHPETPGIEGTDGDEVEESWTSPFLGMSSTQPTMPCTNKL